MEILYLTGGGLGNLVHSLFAIEAIKKLGHDLTVWVGTEWQGQAQFVRHDNVIVGEPPDPADFDRVFVAPYALTGSSAKWAAHFDGKAEGSPVPINGQYTEVEHNFWFARVAGWSGLMPSPAIKTCDVSPIIGDYVVIAPGVQSGSAVWLKKRYRHWGQVASKLFDKSIKCVFVGAKADTDPKFDRYVNLCGETGLWEASGVLAKARVVLAVDNGLSCVSAAIGVPTVVLWGMSDEVKNRKFGPRVRNIVSTLQCRPCQHTELLTSCVNANCMDTIPVQDVVDAALAEWEGNS